MKRNQQRRREDHPPQPGQSADDIQQALARWRRELAFAIAQHPHLAAKARKLGIMIDDEEPGGIH